MSPDPIGFRIPALIDIVVVYLTWIIPIALVVSLVLKLISRRSHSKLKSNLKNLILAFIPPFGFITLSIMYILVQLRHSSSDFMTIIQPSLVLTIFLLCTTLIIFLLLELLDLIFRLKFPLNLIILTLAILIIAFLFPKTSYERRYSSSSLITTYCSCFGFQIERSFSSESKCMGIPYACTTQIKSCKLDHLAGGGCFGIEMGSPQ